MSKVVLYMSMSVDGFITGPDDGIDTGSASTESDCTTGCAMAALIRIRAGRPMDPALPCSTS